MSGEQHATLLKSELGRNYMSQSLNTFMNDLKQWFSLWEVGHLAMFGDTFDCHNWGGGAIGI